MDEQNNQVIPKQDLSIVVEEDDSKTTIAMPQNEGLIIGDAVNKCLEELKLNGIEKLSHGEIRNALFNSINDAFDVHNIECARGETFKRIKELPNNVIAKALAARCIAGLLSWNTKDPDDGIVMIYQEEGYDKGIYSSSDLMFQKLVKEYKDSYLKPKDVDEVKKLMRSELKMISVTDDPNLVFLKNGILNLKTKKMLEFTPDIVSTRKNRYGLEYDPVTRDILPVAPPMFPMDDGSMWTFDEWLTTLSSHPRVINLLWQVISAVCRPNVRYGKCAVFNNSDGNNGKGTLCELLKELAGEYVSIPFSKFSDGSFLKDIVKSSAIICDENSTDSYIKDPSNLKAIISGDTFALRCLFLDAKTFAFRGVVIQCANGVPKSSDTSESFYRRFIIIPFDNRFEGCEKKIIKDRFMHSEELIRYVLWKVLTQMPIFDTFDVPEECEQEMEKYKLGNDPVLQFVQDIIPQLKWNKVPCAFLHDLYMAYCRENNPSGRTLGITNFTERAVRYVMKYFPGDWEYKKQVHFGKKDNTEGEPLVVEYGLPEARWKSPTYKGTDPVKIGMPNFSESYKSVFVRRDVDDDSNDND